MSTDKNQSCSKLPEMAKKIGRQWFMDFLARPEKNMGGVQKWKTSKLFKIAWNGEKIGRKRGFGLFSPHHKNKFGGRTKKCCQKWKKKSSSELPEMARKLDTNDFWMFKPPSTQV